MPDLSGFPALDVAIGLAFMFFLLSTVCSAINESIANLLGWRAKTLEDGLRSLFGDERVTGGVSQWFTRLKGSFKKQEDRPSPSHAPLEDMTTHVMRHPRVKALVRDPNARSRRRNRPSYLPSHVVSLVVAETLLEGPADASDDEDTTLWAQADATAFRAAEDKLKDVPGREVLLDALRRAEDDVERFRIRVETAFDEVMERASGWYKRKTQLVVAIVATAVAIGLNVDTVRVATRLWNDDTVRSSVAAKAIATAQQGTSGAGAASQPRPTGSTGASGAGADPCAKKAGATATTPSGQGAKAKPKPPEQVQADRLNCLADSVDRVKALQLPVGWGAGNAPKKEVGAVVRRVPGWLITIFALTLGAPFWFDTLSRFARLRGSGVAEQPRSLSDTAGSRRRGRRAAGRPARDRQRRRLQDEPRARPPGQSE